MELSKNSARTIVHADRLLNESTMQRKSYVNLAILSCLALSTVAFGQALPDGKGKAEFQHICSNCHTTALATRTRHSADEWKSIVDEMVSRGAQGSDEELDDVVIYLSTNFRPESGSTASTSAPSSPHSAPSQAVSAASPQIDRAKAVLQKNGCSACHRVENEGGYLAPSLNGVGARRKPEEIRASIVNPQSEVRPENRQVQLTTREEKVVIGKLLNQDGNTVQLVDVSGKSASYSKADLREFKIVDKNPMPSFRSKITSQDLDSLVHYLSTLTEPDR